MAGHYWWEHRLAAYTVLQSDPLQLLGAFCFYFMSLKLKFHPPPQCYRNCFWGGLFYFPQLPFYSNWLINTPNNLILNFQWLRNAVLFFSSKVLISLPFHPKGPATDFKVLIYELSPNRYWQKAISFYLVYSLWTKEIQVAVEKKTNKNTTQRNTAKFS